MLEPVSSIGTLLIDGGCSPVGCCRGARLVSALKISKGDAIGPCNMAVSQLFSDWIPKAEAR